MNVKRRHKSVCNVRILDWTNAGYQKKFCYKSSKSYSKRYVCGSYLIFHERLKALSVVFQARADQAEQEQAQMAMFQQFLAAQQQQQLMLQQQQIPSVSGECSVIRSVGDPGTSLNLQRSNDASQSDGDQKATTTAGSVLTGKTVTSGSSNIAGLDEDYDAPE